MSVITERHTTSSLPSPADDVIIRRLSQQFKDCSTRTIARIARMSQLDGPIRPAPPQGQPYKVQYQKVATGKDAVSAIALACLNILLEGLFLVWLVMPHHWVDYSDAPGYLWWINLLVVCSIGIVEFFRFINTVSMSIASVRMRYPIPIEPEPHMRVAFLTSIVPKSEPIEMLENTLRWALEIEYDGPLDIWVLDEGNLDEVKNLCTRLCKVYPGWRVVKHFSRKGIAKYNTGPDSTFAACTKHGNYNAWLDAIGKHYEYMATVDTDHVPVASYLQRTLGYFRDPDVAFVTGPQFYQNVKNWITAAAESQQYPFHSIIQPGGNASGSSMFVGTNNVFSVDALVANGGLTHSVTEDMATSLSIHSSRNPATGNRWKSVYTPALLAVGEGPTSWGEYFKQQDRWCAGTIDRLLKFWKLFKLAPKQLWHYSLIMSFYPSMALGWMLGALNAWLYALFGTGGIVLPVYMWVALFLDTTATQMFLYSRNRRHNVSPFEPEGTPGFKGMIVSVLCAPVFANSTVMTMAGKSTKFNVTAKGKVIKREELMSHKVHLGWAVVFIGAISVALYNGYFVTQALLLPGLSLIVCLTPVVHGTLLPLIREWWTYLLTQTNPRGRHGAKTS